MSLNERTKSILTQKLKFTPEQIGRLETNPDLQQETWNLIKMIRLSPEKEEIRQYAKIQFKKIKQSLDEPELNNDDILRRARSEHYTFERAFK